MSLNMKVILLLALAPFLAFWGWQIGVGYSALLTGDGGQTFVMAPSHFGWYSAGIVLVGIRLLLVVSEALRCWVCNWISDDRANQ